MSSRPAPWEVYNQALTTLKFGDALWEPGPIYSYKRVRLGDVGYIRRGRFHLLFSAGVPLGSRELGVDVPVTFEPLSIGSVVSGQTRPPGYLRTDAVQQIGVDVGGSGTVACTVEPGAKIAFELTSKRGAALITKHKTYREDIERELNFKNYIKKHYESWVDFSQEVGHGDDIRPILVTGVDLTREFAAVAYSDNYTRVKCEFSAAVPTVASTSMAVWGSWRTGGLVHTNCGPDPVPITREDRGSSESSALPSTIPDEYDHCVFIRYYTIRRRFLIPTVIKAGAGPHQLPESDPGGDNTGEEVHWPSPVDDPIDADPPETGSPALDEVVHNVPLSDRDGFDVVAEFIFQRSEANSVLLHHHDVQGLLQEDEGETIRVLAESGIAERVEIDENGVGQLVSPGATKTSKPGGYGGEVNVAHTGCSPIQLEAQSSSFDATDAREPGASDGSLTTQVAFGPLAHQDKVRRVIATLSVDGPKANLEKFTSFRTRYYRSDTGKESQIWLQSKINEITTNSASKSLRGLIWTREFHHSWAQSSIITGINGATSPDETVIISAYQDSTNMFPFLPSPGADCGGSGTVAILEAYRALLESDFRPNRTVEFHWYSAREAGLLGSQAVADEYKAHGFKVVAVSQFGMTAWVKRGTREEVGIITDFTNDKLTQFNKGLVQEYLSIPYVETKCGHAYSDHASWTNAGYPAISTIESSFANSNHHIHSTDDRIDISGEFSFSHLLEFSKLAVAFAIELGG